MTGFLGDNGAVVERKRVRRAALQSCVARLPRGYIIAMEACGSVHHWACLAARHGHRARLMSPQFVVPCIKPNKNNANDADAIAEASARPTLKLLPSRVTVSA